MHFPRPHAEVGRIGQNVDFFLPCQQKGILWEANIVADTYAKSGMFCLESAELGLAGLHIVAFKEGDPIWYIDIE